MEDLPDLTKHEAKNKTKQKRQKTQKLQGKTLLNLNIRPTANTFYYNPYLQYNYI